MPRNNKVTEKVFANIAETGGRKGAYDKFLAIDQEMGLEINEPLQQMKEQYAAISKTCAEDIKVLAALEEIIIQMRAKQVIDSELRLSLSRDYIYARSLFFRRRNQINDIRVVVGQVEEYGDELDNLLNDPIFRSICKKKLIEAMDKEIEKNVQYLTQLITV